MGLDTAPNDTSYTTLSTGFKEENSPPITGVDSSQGSIEPLPTTRRALLFLEISLLIVLLSGIISSTVAGAKTRRASDLTTTI